MSALLTILGLSITTIATASSGLTTTNNDIEPEFVPYVNSFRAAFEVATGKPLRIEHLTIYKGEPLGVVLEGNLNEIAECERLPNKDRIIIRELRGWNNLTELERENLLFHELGHCVLGLSHSKTGIMSKTLLESALYKKERGRYLREFFEDGKMSLQSPSSWEDKP